MGDKRRLKYVPSPEDPGLDFGPEDFEEVQQRVPEPESLYVVGRQRMKHEKIQSFMLPGSPTIATLTL